MRKDTTKASTGPESFEDALTALLREGAQKLLMQRDIPVASIAHGTGFVSASHFSQVFRRHTGQTPSEYRNQHLTYPEN